MIVDTLLPSIIISDPNYHQLVLKEKNMMKTHILKAFIVLFLGIFPYLSYAELMCMDTQGPRSARSDDAPSVASCPSDYTLTGCTCYSPWDSCDGARPNNTNNICTAYNKNKGAGVFAEATCCLIVPKNEKVPPPISKEGNLQVKVKPANSGTITVKVWLAQRPGGTPLNETFEVTKENPLNKTWQLEPARYAVTISWSAGYHNISGSTAGNGIIINGNNLYYQVLGEPSNQNSIHATFGVRVTQ